MPSSVKKSCWISQVSEGQSIPLHDLHSDGGRSNTCHQIALAWSGDAVLVESPKSEQRVTMTIASVVVDREMCRYWTRSTRRVDDPPHNFRSFMQVDFVIGRQRHREVQPHLWQSTPILKRRVDFLQLSMVKRGCEDRGDVKFGWIICGPHDLLMREVGRQMPVVVQQSPIGNNSSGSIGDEPCRSRTGRQVDRVQSRKNDRHVTGSVHLVY